MLDHSAWPLYKKLGCLKVSKDLVAPLGMTDRANDKDAKSEAWDSNPWCPFHDYHLVLYPRSAVPEEGSVIDIHGLGW